MCLSLVSVSLCVCNVLCSDGVTRDDRIQVGMLDCCAGRDVRLQCRQG